VVAWKDIVAGGLTFVIAHAIEVVGWPWFDPGRSSTPWFLNAGRAAAFTAGCLVLAAAAATALAASVPGRGAIARGGGIAVGAIAAMTIVLVARGPGTLFPIVLVFGAAIALASGVVGAALGNGLAAARRGRRA